VLSKRRGGVEGVLQHPAHRDRDQVVAISLDFPLLQRVCDHDGIAMVNGSFRPIVKSMRISLAPADRHEDQARKWTRAVRLKQHVFMVSPVRLRGIWELQISLLERNGERIEYLSARPAGYDAQKQSGLNRTGFVGGFNS
jgi:hypothetical protein